MQKFTKLSAILLMAIYLLAACGSSPNINSGQSRGGSANNSAASANKQNTAVNQNTSENKPTQTANINKPADEMPKFKKGEPYKSVREKLIKAGWTPFKSKDADKCLEGDERCQDYPEMEACAGTGLGNCRYLWKKGNKTLAIFTISDSPIYDGQKFVKTS